VRRRIGEQMISACVVPIEKHGGGGVMVWWFFAGDTVSDLFRNQCTPNQHGYLSILQRYSVETGENVALWCRTSPISISKREGQRQRSIERGKIDV
jgi:hypothetical protein